MSVTAKKGDGGLTDLSKTKNIPKSDERIRLLGELEELTSHLGILKSQVSIPWIKESLKDTQRTLILVMDGVTEPHNLKYRLKDSEILKLEEETVRMSGHGKAAKERVIPGKTSLTAGIDLARSVTRRCESQLAAVTVKYGSDKTVRQYMNRLSDYLYALARYLETGAEEHSLIFGEDKPKERQMQICEAGSMDQVQDKVVQEVLRRIGQGPGMTLLLAKKLIERLEAYAEKLGKKAVFAVCSSDGNPVAVHVMDGAFLVSFDVALKKAYTSAAVKMSTRELGRMVQPGGTFQGLDQLQGDKMVFFGGGVPLFAEGRLAGALGVSGGTGEEDHVLAEFGQKIFQEII